MKLTIFNELDFLPALKAFFAELQVPIASVTDRSIAAKEIFTSTYRDTESFQLIDDVYFLGMVDDGAFRGDRVINLAAAQGLERDYDGLVIFGVTLRDDRISPNPIAISTLTKSNRDRLFQNNT